MNRPPWGNLGAVFSFPDFTAQGSKLMHPNPAFRTAAIDANLAFARNRGFGMLTLNGPDGPIAAHIPFLISADGTMIDLHLARSNPIARSPLPAKALIAVSGPDAYISPDWYGVPDQVPTWNYVAVHLRGTLRELPVQTLREHADALSARFEADLLPKKPWISGKMTEGMMDRMMRMIVPFRLDIEAVDGTWKLNQNKDARVRLAAAEALARQPFEGAAQTLAGLMRTAD
jgi:transcriptional regulator